MKNPKKKKRIYIYIFPLPTFPAQMIFKTKKNKRSGKEMKTTSAHQEDFNKKCLTWQK